MSDSTTAHLSKEVAAAREALIAQVATDPDHWWSAYDLKVAVRNGWTSGAMSLALNQLVDEGVLEAQKGKVRQHR